MSKFVQITIDGPASSGKTTMGKAICDYFKIKLIDTGLYYRAFTWYLYKNKVDFSKPQLIIKYLKNFEFNIYHMTICKEKLKDKDLQSLFISKYINIVSQIQEVRNHLIVMQKTQAKSTDCLLVGRDAGSIIVPESSCKFFLTADIEIRAKRRYNQNLKSNIKSNLNDIINSIKNRDFKDKNRKNSPLIKIKDMILIDNSKLSQKETLNLMINLIEKKIKKFSNEKK